jgi:hypothetical protein
MDLAPECSEDDAPQHGDGDDDESSSVGNEDDTEVEVGGDPAAYPLLLIAQNASRDDLLGKEIRMDCYFEEVSSTRVEEVLSVGHGNCEATMLTLVRRAIDHVQGMEKISKEIGKERYFSIYPKDIYPKDIYPKDIPYMYPPANAQEGC